MKSFRTFNVTSRLTTTWGCTNRFSTSRTSGAWWETPFCLILRRWTKLRKCKLKECQRPTQMTNATNSRWSGKTLQGRWDLLIVTCTWIILCTTRCSDSLKSKILSGAFNRKVTTTSTSVSGWRPTFTCSRLLPSFRCCTLCLSVSPSRMTSSSGMPRRTWRASLSSHYTLTLACR